MKSDASSLYPSEHVANAVTTYSSDHSSPLPPYISAYHDHISSTHKRSGYMISNFQCQAHLFLARTIGAKRILEIGTFVGYSALGWAQAVGQEGKVLSLEFDPAFAAQARKVVEENGLDKVVEILVGDADETLKKLTPAEPFDLIFVDANKTGYPSYLETILSRSQPGSANRLLREGGLIMADNVLRRGLVADASELNPHASSDKGHNPGEKTAHQLDEDLQALRKYNEMVKNEERLDTLVLPVWDGVSLARLTN